MILASSVSLAGISQDRPWGVRYSVRTARIKNHYRMRSWISFPRSWICFPRSWTSFPRSWNCFPRSWISFPRSWISFPIYLISFPRSWICFPRSWTHWPIFSTQFWKITASFYFILFYSIRFAVLNNRDSCDLWHCIAYCVSF